MRTEEKETLRAAIRQMIVTHFTALVIMLACVISEAHCTPIPATPQPQHVVEHDPGAWAFTTGSIAVAGGIYRPWFGFAAGTAVGVLANLQDSNNARQNMVGSIAGAAAGYVIIKTLKHDWHKR